MPQAAAARKAQQARPGSRVSASLSRWAAMPASSPSSAVSTRAPRAVGSSRAAIWLTGSPRPAGCACSGWTETRRPKPPLLRPVGGKIRFCRHALRLARIEQGREAEAGGLAGRAFAADLAVHGSRQLAGDVQVELSLCKRENSRILPMIRTRMRAGKRIFPENPVGGARHPRAAAIRSGPDVAPGRAQFMVHMGEHAHYRQDAEQRDQDVTPEHFPVHEGHFHGLGPLHRPAARWKSPGSTCRDQENSVFKKTWLYLENQ